jgi:soluble lytic murein transglycosylase
MTFTQAPAKLRAMRTLQTFSRRAASGLVLVIAAALLGAGDSPGDDVVRAEFMAAMQRIKLHEPEPKDSAALEAYAIHDYLVAARLRSSLAARPTPELDGIIDRFVHSHAGQPVARPLHRDWLQSLADRGRWDWFLPRAADATDPTLVCERLEGELATGRTEGLAAAALMRWVLPQQQPHQCDAVFEWLRSQNMLTPALAEARTRAALAADNPRLARDFATDLGPALSAPLLQWAALLENPQPVLERAADDPKQAVMPDALIAGFTRFARSDPPAALELLPRLEQRPDLAPAVRAKLARAAALGAALGRYAGAVAAFEAVPTEAVDDSVQEWRVRAALWSGNYAKALAWIEQMPPVLATLPRWRYWRARALGATAGETAAAPLYAQLAGLRDYYGYLAADRIHDTYKLNDRPSLEDSEVQQELAMEPGLVRAHELFDCGLTDDAAAEWALVIGPEVPAVKVQAALLAARWGWYAQSIATLAQSAEFDDVHLRYPRPYAAAVDAAAGLAHVPADWVFGVLRQESLYRKDAVSRADARGLMQMQPSTAQGVARRWQLAPLPANALFDPTLSIQLGAAHLRDLLDHYGGQLDLTLAAYNAGIAAVARWLPASPIDADVWIENIPYNETRGYVQHVLEHIVAFAWVRDGELPRLGALLPPVGPATLACNQVSPLGCK